MDLIDIIITIAILGIGGLLSGGKKKLSQQQAAPNRQSQAPGQAASTQRPQGGNSVFGSFIDDVIRQSTGKKNKAPRQQQAAKQEYFSYENQPVDWNASPAKEQNSQTADETNPSVQLQEWFDLRQAVIYQTIMENNYIADMK